MNKEIAKSWVEALRSGEYTQGKNMLRYRDNYCCLGVLCDLAKVNWESGADGTYRVEGSSIMIPSMILERVGLKWIRARDLAAMNDSGKTFSEIADEIERTMDE